ncbi:A-kinase-interacting protein 1 isoform X4 [Salmo salar]|uniref:A-kinase-interacting protein 1 isoform X4 n=1 Tax=Salmo salar TaxID=8030 RepID=A0A1S3PD10_SALSA|nr:A-kinase-interacting protein 1 isoform X4 [Salmo salar]|eukprot:XP_014025568.1 PREDICTED: A-kinase-interacting protein 1-like isoform X4 [Salmo salar]
MELSLLRSARLGLEVLERASRRSVDWSSANPCPSTTPKDDNAGSEEVQGDSAHTSLDDAFETIAEFMAQTTYQCKAQSSPEDFHIEVSPGTYKITAGTQDSQQQTRVVRINAGESMNLTFHL